MHSPTTSGSGWLCSCVVPRHRYLPILRKEQGRQSDASFANFVEIAYASSSEADYQLLLARGVGYLEPTQYDTLATELAEIRKMLAALRRTLRMGRRA